MTNLLEKLAGKPSMSAEERTEQIGKIVDKIAIKQSIPQNTIRKIILDWMEFQAEYLKL